MTGRLLRISVVLSALAVLAMESWWGWREWYSAEQINAARDAGDAEKVCRLLRWGARADKDEWLLHWAANDNLVVAKLLLANGTKVDAKDANGWTPLHVAADNRNSVVAKLLLAHGSNPNVKDKSGKTPLDRMPELAEIVKKLETEKAGKKQPAQPKVATP